MAVRDTSDDPLAGLSADELLRVLGHEIGNLVTIVSGYGQMLRDHWEFLADERRLDIVGRMNRQVDQLRVLIDNFQHLRWLTVATQAPALGPTTDIADLVNALAHDLGGRPVNRHLQADKQTHKTRDTDHRSAAHESAHDVTDR